MSLTPLELKHKLGGVFGFPVTPMKPDLAIDLESLRENVRRYLTTQVSALFAAAGTGEFFSLSLDEYQQVVSSVVEEVNGKIPVLAGCGYGTALAMQYARIAQESGADGLLLLPPYLVQTEQRGLIEHYRRIADSVKIGVVLYQRDNAIFNPETVASLAEAHENLIGFKDGHGNLEQFQRVVLRLGDRLAYMNGMPTAEMTAPAYFASGCRSYSSAISNFIPHVTIRFHEALVNGEMATVNAILRDVIIPLCRVRDLGKGYAVSYVKAAMAICGFPAGPVRPPLCNLLKEESSKLEEILKDILQKYPST